MTDVDGKVGIGSVGVSLSDDLIAKAIGMAHRCLVAALMTRLAARGYGDLTPAFTGVMPLLNAPGTRSTVLAQQAGITKQAMGRLIQELEARRYVERVADPTDNRAKIVRLTKRGVEIREACLQAMQELELLATETLSKSELSKLQRNLKRLTIAFGQPIER
jgi:DNA-binding MarR family transcriptional regulator